MKNEKIKELVIGKDVKDISECIKKVRTLKSLSQDDVFVRTNISQNLLSMYETRKRKITDSKLLTIVDGLDAELVVRFEEEDSVMNKDKLKEYNMNDDINYMKRLFELISIGSINEEMIDKMILEMKDKNILDESANETINLLKIEIEKLKLIKNMDVEKYTPIIYDDGNRLLDKLYIDDLQVIDLIYRFDSIDKLYSALEKTKQHLDIQCELKENLDILYNRIIKKYLFENVSFKFFISYNKLVKVDINIYEKFNVKYKSIDLDDYEFEDVDDFMKFSKLYKEKLTKLKRIEKLSLECEHKDINNFVDNIIKNLKNTFKEYNIEIDDIYFENLEESLNEICNDINQYLNLKRDIYIEQYNKSPYCLSNLSDIFEIQIGMLDINFWYNDGSDFEYDYYKDYACIGCDIRFIDDIDNVYYSDVIISDIYTNDKYKDIQFEFLVKCGLKKVQEVMNKLEYINNNTKL